VPGELHALSDNEASILLAFMDTMESRRITHAVQGWRITRSERFCIVECVCEGRSFSGVAETFDEARKKLADEMVATALDGWPGIGRG
jgi:hypothetical protein